MYSQLGLCNSEEDWTLETQIVGTIENLISLVISYALNHGIFNK